jgi:hypothetical protein
MLHKSNKSLHLLLMAIASCAMYASASAQATRTWVSGVGNDANPCSRTAPCKTFAGAISKTATGGEIDVLDPGGFGTVTITKAITIQSDQENGGILASGTTGIIINTALATDVVTLRGLVITGDITGLNGIQFVKGAALHVENCHIRQFNAANGFGILFAPSTGASRLYVSDTTINDNGDGVAGGGINIAPTGTAIVLAEIDHTHVENNQGYGVKVNNNGFATIRHADISGNKLSGVAAFTGAVGSDIVLKDSVISDDGWNGSSTQGGVLASGTLAFVHLTDNLITENIFALRSLSSGKILSFGNNKLTSNTANGAPTGPETEL